jgi:hypothetical protein
MNHEKKKDKRKEKEKDGGCGPAKVRTSAIFQYSTYSTCTC